MIKLNNIFKTNIINFILIFILVLANLLDIQSIGFIFSTVSLFFYIIYILKQSEINIIKYQISFVLISYVVVDYIFNYTPIKISFEIKYIADFISIILIYKIILNLEKYKKIYKDKILIILIIFILYNFLYSIIINSSLYDFINSIRIYFRFIPLYIIVSNNIVDLKGEYYFYYFINLIIFIIQFILNTHRDVINGIFGLTGPSTFAIFVMIMSIVINYKYINKKCSLVIFILNLILTYTLFVIQENKAFIIIFSLVLFIINLVVKGNFLKKITIYISGGIIIVFSINFLLILFPNFQDMFSKDTARTFIEEYAFGNNNPKFSIGRLEAISYMNMNELNTDYDKIFGKGLGTALPDENWYYNDTGARRDREVFELPSSTMYDKYGSLFGYHLSTLTTTYIEVGIIGIFFVGIILVIFTFRVLKLFLFNPLTENKIIGSIGGMTIISFLFATIYGSDMISRQFTMIIFLIMGIVTQKYLK